MDGSAELEQPTPDHCNGTPPTEVSLVEGPATMANTGADEEEGAKFRYPNPGGNFFTGMDTTSEVSKGVQTVAE